MFNVCLVNELIRNKVDFSKDQSSLNSFSAIVLTSARQVGKSAFLLHEFPDCNYYDLGDLEILDRARTDPNSLWMGVSKSCLRRCPKVFQNSFFSEARY